MPLSHRHLRTACLAAAVLAAMPAHAASVCIVTATPLVFGAYNPVDGTALQINATVTASCSALSLPLQALPYTLSLGPSSTTGTMNRALAGPMGARLNYNLYTSGAYSTVWGDGSGSSGTVSGSLTPAAIGVPALRAHTVHGRVPTGQSTRVGIYGDSILVTIDY